MPASLTAPAPFRALGTLPIIAFALLFWLFTYAFLSWRTEMLLGDGFSLFSIRRVLGTSAGAAIYGLVLCWIERPVAERTAARLLAIVATILPASIAVLAARLAVDRLFYESALPLAVNLRWVLAWSGYFGMWVSASLAFQMHRSTLAQVPARAVAQHGPHAPASAAAPGAAWEWLIDTAARELAAMPDADRAALADRLVASAGYHVAEGLDAEAQNARVDLAWQIAARLARDQRMSGPA